MAGRGLGGSPAGKEKATRARKGLEEKEKMNANMGGGIRSTGLMGIGRCGGRWGQGYRPQGIGA